MRQSRYTGDFDFATGASGRRPMGGPVYRYDADLDSDTKWPEHYDGQPFFYEWGQRRIYNFVLTTSGTSSRPTGRCRTSCRPTFPEPAADGSTAACAAH